MIRRLEGKIADAGLTHVIVDVGGVGYLVHTVEPGTNFLLEYPVVLWTHLAVRENALDLYGFQTRDELEIFELLLTLPKIGPKSAQQILTQASVPLLSKAVSEQDATYLSKMSGLGKKTAEKIVTELKDKLPEAAWNQDVPAGVSRTENHQELSDVIDALVSLGYPQRDAREAVQQLPPEIVGANAAIREALKLLSR